MVDLVIKNVRVVHPEGEELADVVVRGPLVVGVRSATAGVGARLEVDAAGRRLIPGAVDLHVHLREPGMPEAETFRSGTGAALAGGVTTVLDMPNTRPPTTSESALEDKAALAAAGIHVDVGLWAGFDPERPDWHAGLAEAGRIPGLKVYLGRSTGDLSTGSSEALRQAIRATSGRPVVFHAEDQDTLDQAAAARAPARCGVEDHSRLRPVAAAVRAVERVAELARSLPGSRLHLAHVSSAEELSLLDRPGLEGQVHTEVTPHHLFLDTGCLLELGNLGRVNPPLRSPEVRAGLVGAFRDGRLHAWATDHAPHPCEAKARPYDQAPSGMPGLDVSLRLAVLAVHRRWMSWRDLVRRLCADPAGFVGLRDRGRVAEGLRADLVLLPQDDAPLRPLRASEIQSRCGWSPYVGMPLPPPPERVFFAGREAAAGGEILPGPLRGALPRFDPLF